MKYTGNADKQRVNRQSWFGNMTSMTSCQSLEIRRFLKKWSQNEGRIMTKDMTQL
jgi:hypothetical protein